MGDEVITESDLQAEALRVGAVAVDMRQRDLIVRRGGFMPSDKDIPILRIAAGPTVFVTELLERWDVHLINRTQQNSYIQDGLGAQGWYGGAADVLNVEHIVLPKRMNLCFELLEFAFPGGIMREKQNLVTGYTLQVQTSLRG